MPKARNKKLTAKQSAFIHKYLDKSDKKTFLNGSQSAAAVYNVSNGNSARAIASKTLTLPNVRNELERLASQLGMGVQVRLEHLQGWILGHGTRDTVTNSYSRDKMGKLVVVARTVVSKAPSVRDSIAALNLLQKSTGHYKDLDTARDEAIKELEDLHSELVPKDVQREIDRDLTCTGAGTGAGAGAQG